MAAHLATFAPVIVVILKKTAGIQEILSSLGIEALNDMQQAMMAACGMHKDIILLSPTGTGKTLAFLLPVMQGMDSRKRGTQALVITPSRELAVQIEKVAKAMGMGMKVSCCYGGHSIETEENNLKEPPALLIGTPGRLMDHMHRGNITTDAIKTLVLDEFDKSLELGFHDEMEFIVRELQAVDRKILTSATDAAELPDFMQLYEPYKLDFLQRQEMTSKLQLKVVVSEDKDKADVLFRLLCTLGNGQSIVFCNHRAAVERTGALLSEKGIVNARYHGALEQQDRDAALCKFRNGSVHVLVTTDLGARGLDIPEVANVIHYHLPHTEESYTHRNGRTARMGAEGTAIIILGPEESLPEYIDPATPHMQLPMQVKIPAAPHWVTLFISAGKKDKVNKVDIVGYLTQKGNLKKEEIGLIEVKDFLSFVAVKRTKATRTLELIRDENIKNKRVRVFVAK